MDMESNMAKVNSVHDKHACQGTDLSFSRERSRVSGRATGCEVVPQGPPKLAEK